MPSSIGSKMARFVRLALLMLLAALPVGLCFIADRIPAEYRGLLPGHYLPDVRLVTIDGATIRTRSWLGRPTLVVLFRPGCRACEEEVANLEALAPTVLPVRIALISTEASGRLDSSLPEYFDPTGEFLGKARRLAVPVLYWVNSEGRVEYVRTGVRRLTEDAAILRRLLEKETVP